MIFQKNKITKKIAFILVIFTIFISLSAVSLEAGRCEEAFFRCLDDPFWKAAPFGIIFCATGYFFCKKYIER